MINAIWLKLLKIGAAIAAPLLMAWALYSSGRNKAKAEAAEIEAERKIAETQENANRILAQMNANKEQTEKVIQNANDVQTGNANLADGVVIDQLRDKWTRD